MLLCLVFEPFVAGGFRLADAKELMLLQNAQQNHNSRLLLKGARLD